MSSIYLIPWILYGFLYCKFAYKTRFTLYRYNTQYLLFTVLTYGTIAIMPAMVIVSLLSLFFGMIGWVKVRNFDEFFLNLSGGLDKNYAEISLVLLIGALITYLLIKKHNDGASKLIRKVLKESKVDENEESYKSKVESYVYMKTLENDPMKEKIARNFFFNLNSKKKPKYLMFDIGKDKVYVGIVVKIGLPNDNHLPESIGITPFLSGYRNEEKKVVFTTDYSGKEFSETLFKESDIVSIKDFDEETYKSFIDFNVKKENH